MVGVLRKIGPFGMQTDKSEYESWLPGARPNACLKVLFTLICLCLFPSAPGMAAGVYIVDTNKQPDSLAIAHALNHHCTPCQPVKYLDMGGSYAIGRQILEELKSRQSTDGVDLIITLGARATRMIAGEFPDTPIFYSLTEQPTNKPHEGAPLVDFSARPSIGFQLDVLRTMSPDIGRIGFIASRSSLEPLKEEALEAARQLGMQIKFYYVQHSHDVSTGLRTAIQETDALMLIRDRVAVNADTLNYILQLTLENRIPTMAYTPSLVERGILSALTPDPVRLGEKLGIAIQAYLETGTLPDTATDPSLFELHINGAAMKQTPMVTATAPTGVKVVMR